jgi:APA family basic amino acid/polyamine antiporter
MRFVVGSAGIAALGVGFATFLSAVIPMPMVWAQRTLHVLGRDIQWQFGMREVVAVSAILLFGTINCVGVAFGGRLQSVLTAAKVLGIAVIVVGAFLFADGGSLQHFRSPAIAHRWTGLQGFGAAVVSALWACDGWAYMPMVAGEVQEPERNIPRALTFGVLAVLALYALANLAYFWALPFEQVLSSNSNLYRSALPVAAKAAETFLGRRGPAIVSVLFMVSAAGALNGVVLATARIPYMMSRDGLLFTKMGEIHKISRVPVWAIGVVSVWASLLAVSGSFDQLTDMSVFAFWVFYALAASAVFVLRKSQPHAPRPYRTFGYPLLPALFVSTASWLVFNTLQTSPLEAGAGLLLILLGLPVFFFYRRRRTLRGQPGDPDDAGLHAGREQQ